MLPFFYLFTSHLTYRRDFSQPHSQDPTLRCRNQAIVQDGPSAQVPCLKIRPMVPNSQCGSITVRWGEWGDHFSVTSVLSKAFRDSRASHNPGMSTHTGDARFVAPRFSNLTFTSLTWSVLRVFLLKVYQVSNFKMALNYFPVARLKYRRGYGFRDSMIRL